MSAPIRLQVGANNATLELWRLAETDQTEGLEHILSRGADINASNCDGVTALMRAAYNGRVRMVHALIDHGAELNASRADGFTALLLAAFFGHADVVKALVERGADLSTASRFATSAEMWATARAFYEVANYLNQAQNISQPPDPLVSLPENGTKEKYSKPEPVPPARPAPVNFEPAGEASSVEIKERPISEVVKVPLPTAPDSDKPATRRSVRTLKDPPEIWDLVHEEPGQFKPGWAFVTRVTSSKTNLVLLMVVLMAISGLSTFGVLKLRGGLKGATWTAQEAEKGNESRPLPAPAVAAPITQPDAEKASQLTAPELVNPATNNEPAIAINPLDRPASGAEAPDGTRVPAVVGNRTFRAGPRRRTASSKSASLPEQGENVTGAAVVTQIPQTAPVSAEVKQQNSSDPSAVRKRSTVDSSTQLIGPTENSSRPKAKVIQWP